ncbi:hypothetical protein ERJ75_001379100 [Trypanosoma vivax]|nr:hypothetical protein ERJ75_001379100 [Trypanosoma vivax]
MLRACLAAKRSRCTEKPRAGPFSRRGLDSVEDLLAKSCVQLDRVSRRRVGAAHTAGRVDFPSRRLAWPRITRGALRRPQPRSGAERRDKTRDSFNGHETGAVVSRCSQSRATEDPHGRQTTVERGYCRQVDALALPSFAPERDGARAEWRVRRSAVAWCVACRCSRVAPTLHNAPQRYGGEKRHTQGVARSQPARGQAHFHTACARGATRQRTRDGSERLRSGRQSA